MPERVLAGDECGISVVAWGSRKLQRVVRSSGGAEVQGASVAEDSNLRCGLLLAELMYDRHPDKGNDSNRSLAAYPQQWSLTASMSSTALARRAILSPARETDGRQWQRACFDRT